MTERSPPVELEPRNISLLTAVTLLGAWLTAVSSSVLETNIDWSVSPTLGHSLASPQSAPVPLPSHQFGVFDEKTETEMNVLYMGERPC